jgi:hypothetical protein
MKSWGKKGLGRRGRGVQPGNPGQFGPAKGSFAGRRWVDLEAKKLDMQAPLSVSCLIGQVRPISQNCDVQIDMSSVYGTAKL